MADQVHAGLAHIAALERRANYKNTSRAGLSGVVLQWLVSIESLPEGALRLLCIQIENWAVNEMIRLYAGTGTFFYFDLPYRAHHLLIPQPMVSR